MDTIVPGALAAFVVDCSIFPLDTIKSRIQAEDVQKRYPGGRGLYKGLWQGFGPVVIATLPSAALFFTTYEHAKEALSPPHDTDGQATRTAIAHAASSTIAELASCLILTPAETIKQRRQVALSGSPMARIRLTTTLWSGYWALAGRNLPFTAMQFPLYEYFRRHLATRYHVKPRKGARRRAGHQGEPVRADDVDASERARRRAYMLQQHQHSPSSPPPPPNNTHYIAAGMVSGVAAAGAGAISALATTPLDLVKTRIMLNDDNDDKQGRGVGERKPTIASVTRAVWQREGIRGLMRGALLRSSWSALGAGIYLGSYEAGREWWGNAGGREQAYEVADMLTSP